MKVGSLFAGIGGFDLGFHRAGFDVAWAAEWDKHAQNVLRRRFPGTTVYGDIREIDLERLEQVDVICGGFPCQDLSVAGKRAGLAGERSGLFHDAMRIVRRLRPSVLVLENVPGLLSSNHGLDFATVLREVGEGWDCAEVAWRVLDSQFFGVAQRRRRVFIVAVRDPRVGCSEEILALASSGGGNPPAKREARQGSASDAARCPDGGRGWCYGGGSQETSDTVTSKWHKGSGGPSGNETGLFVAQSVLPIKGAATRTNPTSGPDGVGVSQSGVAYTLEARAEVQAVAFTQPFSPHGHYRYEASEHAATLQDRENRQGGHTHLVAQAFRKSKRAQSANDDETWVDDGLANTLNGFDTGDARTTHAIAFTQNQRDEVRELGDRAASLSGQGTHQTNYVAFTIDMQACKGNANVGDGSVSPTLCKPSGNDCHAVAIGMDAEFNARMEQMGTLKRGGEGGRAECVAIGVDVYNGMETGDVAATVTSATGIANASGPKVISVCGDVTHSLTSNGADASEDGTGRGTPVVAHAFYSTGGSHGLEATPELSPPLKVGSALGIPSPPAVAFSCKDHGADASAVAPTLRAMPHSGSHANGGGQVAVAFAQNQVGEIRTSETMSTIGTTGNASARTTPKIMSGMVVRRLTPVECERLQGFPDGWTDVGTPEKPTADSHRYKQLGNAVTVNVAEWLARRIRRCLEQ